ncbi:MAG: glycosyltransferase family 2 protein [Pseudomonadota bacterium]
MADPKYTIVTTMKNEGPFILEWIAYHRSIGFTDFTVFTNDCDDGTDKIIIRLQELGVASHVVNKLKPRQSPQRLALRRSRWHDKTQEADWLMCADVDEFLLIRTGEGRLQDLMDAVGDVDAISFCWKLFGHSERDHFEPGFVTEQFMWAAPEKAFPNQRSAGIKTLLRNNDKFLRMKVHRPLVAEDPKDLKWVDAGGQPMPERYLKAHWSAHRQFSHEYARLYHYAVRSIDSFLVKRDRGRTNHIDADQGVDYWQAMNANFAYDDSILERLPAAKREYQALMADPVLSKLHSAACDWHLDKISELKSREGWPEFRAEIAAIDNGAVWREKQKNG